MRRVTYDLVVPLRVNELGATIVSFQLIEKRVVTEKQLLHRADFDALVGHVKRLGCHYVVEEVVDPVLIEEGMCVME